MRPLYPSFADVLPSLGLLLFRVATGTALAISCWRGNHELTALHLIPIAFGMLLLLGLWTRITGLMVVVLELLGVYSHNCNLWLSILLSSLGVALSLLGPGFWSMDAWLSGWKRIDIPRRDR